MVGTFLRKLRSDQTGTALVFTLFISGLMMIAALGIVTVTGDDFQLIGSRSHSSQAKYVADSAVEIIKQQIIQSENNGEHFSADNETGPEVPGGTYTYSVNYREGEPYQIEVTAIINLPNGEDVKKNVEVEYSYKPTDSGNGNNGSNGNHGDGNNGNNGSNGNHGDGNNGNNGSNGNHGDGNNGNNGSNGNHGDGNNGNNGNNGNHNGRPNTGISAQKAWEFSLYKGSGEGVLHLAADNFKGEGQIYSRSKIILQSANPNHLPVDFKGIVRSSEDIQILPDGYSGSGLEIKPYDPVVSVPQVDWNYIRQEADEVYTGNTVLNLNSVSDKEVIYVSGDLTLEGNLSVNALIVATGDIIVVGNYRYPNSDYAVAGIIAGGNLTLKKEGSKKNDEGGPGIRGFAAGINRVIIDGDIKVNGSIIACQNVVFTRGQLEYTSSNDKPALEVLNLFGSRIFSQ